MDVVEEWDQVSARGGIVVGIKDELVWLRAGIADACILIQHILDFAAAADVGLDANVIGRRAVPTSILIDHIIGGEKVVDASVGLAAHREPVPIVKMIVRNGHVRNRADSGLDSNVVVPVRDIRIPDGDVGGSGGIDTVGVGSGSGGGDLCA